MDVGLGGPWPGVNVIKLFTFAEKTVLHNITILGMSEM